MYGDKIIKCFNCKRDLTLEEYNKAYNQCYSEEDMKWSLCNDCEEEKEARQNYCEEFDED